MEIRRTRSQDRILKLLKELPDPISAQDLYIHLRGQSQSMGLATVYRSLDTLKKEGLVQVRTQPTGESLYTTIQEDRHHLTCLNCSKSIPIDECPVHDLEQELTTEHAFKIHYHTLEFFGLCNICQQATV
ncbi:transcriptional repressor [filamentous cyanobacterium LEGE 11480]|uniref:Transcriptional repressor n=1 Tax=Romeriopsis navalis LEGE 11480 TaxID=2777977 RepID=A0A928VSA6_9CYAN|nr:Fur family transcriptional regulator [Romeriopsis navalis]MBE9031179.1 transcriptional repressor [Romeriopsis navalis LEGE 11480]